MGNCQAIDNATLVIQHPCGKSEKLYWPTPAKDVMKMNPGHYVALLLTSTLCASSITKTASTAIPAPTSSTNSVRITRIKLLRPTDTLLLGQVYRLITTQEVMKGLWAKKIAKMKQNKQLETEKNRDESTSESDTRGGNYEPEKSNKEIKHERRHHRQRTTRGGGGSSGAGKSRTWEPSLISISEGGS